MLHNVETYCELKSRADSNRKNFWYILTVLIVSIVFGIFKFKQQDTIIDRYNNATVYKTTAYTLHYSECKKKPDHKEYGKTFTGAQATVGRTVAVDPDYIPLGSHIFIMSGIIIEGKKYYEFIAEDTGNAVKGKQIDIYFGDEKQHDKAIKYGLKYLLVYIKGDK